MRILANYRIFQEANGRTWGFELLDPEGRAVVNAGGFSSRQSASRALSLRMDTACDINPVKDPNAFLRQIFQVKEG